VVFAGFKDAALRARVESELGVIIGSKVTTKTALVVVKTLEDNSAKANKAQKLLIPLSTRDDFIEVYLPKAGNGRAAQNSPSSVLCISTDKEPTASSTPEAPGSNTPDEPTVSSWGRIEEAVDRCTHEVGHSYLEISAEDLISFAVVVEHWIGGADIPCD
jgi:hypothetical protein